MSKLDWTILIIVVLTVAGSVTYAYHKLNSAPRYHSPVIQTLVEKCSERVMVELEFPAAALEDDGSLRGGRVTIVASRKMPACTAI